MALPDLVTKPGGVLHSEVQGVPANGNNVFDAGIHLVALDEQLGGAAAVDEWLSIDVASLDGVVTDATYVSRVGNAITVNFSQGGAGVVLVTARVTHSEVR